MNFGINFPIVGGRSILTLDTFITNPTGKGSSMMGKRENIKKDLAIRYSNLITKYGFFNYQIFKNDKGSKYYFYFKIPSETFDKLTYDVVLEFVADEKKQISFSDISDYSINFFSNSPHMTMTYTYVLNANKIIVDFLKPKYSKKALTTPPKMRNPVEMFGFEKSCYFAALFIRDNKLYEKSFIETKAVPFNAVNKNNLLTMIMSQDAKFIQYQEFKRKETAEKKKQRYQKVNAKNIEEYNRVIKEINRKNKNVKEKVDIRNDKVKTKMNTTFKSPVKSKGFSSTTSKHKPFKSVIKK